MSDLEQPLADRIRPETLDDVVGQKHLLGPGGLLRRFIDSGSNANMIFYGPSGVGKTTVANIIAKRTSRPLYRLNATTASTQDIRDIMGDIGTLIAPNGVLLYLDEIQYFNKRQQQSLLEFMENGKITLIASTTENPYFCVFNALLSRSTVFEFKALSAADVLPAIQRGFRIVGEESKLPLSVEEGVDTYIASACGGDVRKGLNAVEFLYETAQAADGRLTITLADAQQVTQRSAMRYDREGDNHYDLLSALQKSIRGSDPDAAVHYLAKLLVAGDLLSPCRRLLVIAAAILSVIVTYRYRLAVYFLLDNPEMGALAAITESKRAMMGWKGELFIQDLSFLGWWLLLSLASLLAFSLGSIFGLGVGGLLSFLTVKIASLWFSPYIWGTEANFYDWVVHGRYSYRDNSGPDAGYQSPYSNF